MDLETGKSQTEGQSLPSVDKEPAQEAKRLPIGAEGADEAALEKPRQGRGRPKGRKNNKTLEREALIAQGLLQPPKPARRGRPKGRKDDWTLLKEAREAAGEALTEEEMSQRPKRGRPKGRKNNKTLAKEPLMESGMDPRKEGQKE